MLHNKSPQILASRSDTFIFSVSGSAGICLASSSGPEPLTQPYLRRHPGPSHCKHPLWQSPLLRSQSGPGKGPGPCVACFSSRASHEVEGGGGGKREMEIAGFCSLLFHGCCCTPSCAMRSSLGAALTGGEGYTRPWMPGSRDLQVPSQKSASFIALFCSFLILWETLKDTFPTVTLGWLPPSWHSPPCYAQTATSSANSKNSSHS